MNSELMLNGEYEIFDDGRLYSNKTNSFLKGSYACRGKKIFEVLSSFQWS